jgi:hypothetical protein
MSVKYNFFDFILEQTSKNSLVIKKDRCLELINAIAINFIEFPKELEPPSSAVIALSANAGASLPNSLACGLNCVSEKHLLLETICDFIEENYDKDFSFQDLSKRIIPGIGHPSIKGEDPRVEFLLSEFKDVQAERVAFYLKAENKLNPLRMNIGGAMCALMLDAGISKEYIQFFPLMGRIYGWCKTYQKITKEFPKVRPSEIIVNESN